MAQTLNILFVIPGDINLPTGGYRYDRKIIEEFRRLGHQVNILSLEGNYPEPTEKEKYAALQKLRELPDYSVAIVDGLAGGGHPALMETLKIKAPVVALVHHPLCLENGLDSQTAKRLEASEATGLKAASQIVTTSPETTRTVQKLFKVMPRLVDHVLPGVEASTKSKPPNPSQPIRLLCVGSVIERKGHRVLVEALAHLKDLDWRLDCVGKTDFQPELFAKIKDLVSQENLEDRIVFHGAVDEDVLEDTYAHAHVFVLPSLFEGYGMVYAEAIVRGLPVIATTAGAIPDTVPSQCGILVEPGNALALAEALKVMIADPDAQRQYREGALSAANGFPTWRDSGKKFATLLENIT